MKVSITDFPVYKDGKIDKLINLELDMPLEITKGQPTHLDNGIRIGAGLDFVGKKSLSEVHPILVSISVLIHSHLHDYIDRNK